MFPVLSQGAFVSLTDLSNQLTFLFGMLLYIVIMTSHYTCALKHSIPHLLILNYHIHLSSHVQDGVIETVKGGLDKRDDP